VSDVAGTRTIISGNSIWYCDYSAFVVSRCVNDDIWNCRMKLVDGMCSRENAVIVCRACAQTISGNAFINDSERLFVLEAVMFDTKLRQIYNGSASNVEL